MLGRRVSGPEIPSLRSSKRAGSQSLSEVMAHGLRSDGSTSDILPHGSKRQKAYTRAKTDTEIENSKMLAFGLLQKNGVNVHAILKIISGFENTFRRKPRSWVS